MNNEHLNLAMTNEPINNELSNCNLHHLELRVYEVVLEHVSLLLQEVRPWNQTLSGRLFPLPRKQYIHIFYNRSGEAENKILWNIRQKSGCHYFYRNLP